MQTNAQTVIDESVQGDEATFIKALNEKYSTLTVDERIRALYTDFNAEKVMLTSSFASTSAFFLYLFSKIHPEQKVFFIDTGFHFPETIEYKKKLTELYNLNVVEIKAGK